MEQSVQFINAANYELYNCSCCDQLLVNPYQLICGDRICYSCMDSQNKKPIKCARCGEVTRYEECHEDKACFKELQNLIVKCESQGCEWTGKYSERKSHQGECIYVMEHCEHCGRNLTRIEMREHPSLTNYHDGCNLLHRPCLFEAFGCNFKGNSYQLDRHEHEERQYHYHIVSIHLR